MTDEGADFGLGLLCAERFRRPGGDLLCPWRLVVAMAQATFSWPFGPIHLESACLRFRLAAKTAPVPLFLLFPANPLRWASPGVTMDWAKRHQGRIRWATAPPRPIGCFPRTSLRGTRTCKSAENFRRAKSEWLSAVQSGPLGPGIPKIETNAVPVLRLALPNRWWLAWSRRARPPGRAAFGCCKKVVGAAHWAARLSSNRLETQGPPYPNPEEFFENCRGGAEGESAEGREKPPWGVPLPRAGLGPAPTKRNDSLFVRRRSGSKTRPPGFR